MTPSRFIHGYEHVCIMLHSEPNKYRLFTDILYPLIQREQWSLMRKFKLRFQEIPHETVDKIKTSLIVLQQSYHGLPFPLFFFLGLQGWLHVSIKVHFYHVP